MSQSFKLKSYCSSMNYWILIELCGCVLVCQIINYCNANVTICFSYFSINLLLLSQLFCKKRKFWIEVCLFLIAKHCICFIYSKKNCVLCWIFMRLVRISFFFFKCSPLKLAVCYLWPDLKHSMATLTTIQTNDTIQYAFAACICKCIAKM